MSSPHSVLPLSAATVSFLFLFFVSLYVFRFRFRFVFVWQSEKLYEPVYVLAAPEPDAATTFVLHVAYSSSSTPQVPLLVIATLTDARGEMRQSLYLDSTHALAQLWQCALMAMYPTQLSPLPPPPQHPNQTC
jgi:hypothetical protein